MKRPWLGIGLSLVLSLPVLTGCETFNHNLRRQEPDSSKADSDSATDKDTDKVLGVQSEAPKSFFKSSRLSGALSNEGREIERSLGVN